MAQMRKLEVSQGNETVDELDDKLREHKKRSRRRAVGIGALILIAVLSIALWDQLRTFAHYEVVEETELKVSAVAKYENFKGNIVSYSNDGISCRTKDMELLWNQSYEMRNPEVKVCDDYLMVYDQGGTTFYICDEKGVVNCIETTAQIQKGSIAGQGTGAVLLKEGNTSYIKLYDTKGKQLVGGEFHGEKGRFPIDISLSYDAKKLGISFVDLADGKLKSTLTFYNFGSVGQNEIDNQVGEDTYDDVLVAQIQYVSNSKMIAVATDRILVYQGNQKPELEREIPLDQEIVSVFSDEKYIGVVYGNEGEEISYHIVVYDYRGRVVMEQDSTLPYRTIEFLENHEVCLSSEMGCEIYTVYGIKKFQYTFEEPVYKIYARGYLHQYILIEERKAQEVRLK